MKTEAEENDFGQFYYIEEDHISQGSDYEESIEIQNIPLQQEEASQDCEEQEEERDHPPLFLRMERPFRLILLLVLL